MADTPINGLKEENTRLVNDLSFQLKLNNILENIRNNCLLICNHCKCDENKSLLTQINDLNNVYNNLKKRRNHIAIITGKADKTDHRFDQKSANEKKRKHDESAQEDTRRPNHTSNERSGDTNPNFNLITEILKVNDHKNSSETTAQELINPSDIKSESILEESFEEESEWPTLPWPPSVEGFVCYVCNTVFNSRDKLDKHLANSHSIGVLKCYLCDFKTDNEIRFKLHKESHSRGKPFKCTHEGCDKRFRSMYHMNRHRVTHSSSSLFKCPVDGCGQWFQTSVRLSEHKQMKHMNRNNFLKNSGDRPFNCPGCNKAFRYEGSLKSHKCPKESSRDVLASNHSFDFTAESNTGLPENNLFMLEDIPFECEICSDIFETESTLSDHKRQVHRISSGSEESFETSDFADNSSFSYPSTSSMLSSGWPPRGRPPKQPEFKKKANNPPSSYALFIRDIRSQLANTKVEFKTLSQTCSQIWKKMPTNEKEKYHRMAAELRQQMLITRGRAQRVHKKDTKDRKRTNYWNFADGLRASVYREMKDQLATEGKAPSMREVNREIGNRWRQLTDQQKESYRSKDGTNEDEEQEVLVDSVEDNN